MRHQLGEENFTGWLTERSCIYRYYLRLRFWMDFPGLHRDNRTIERRSTPRGYYPDRFARLRSTGPPQAWRRKFCESMMRFEIDPRAFAALEKAIHRHPGTAIAFIEVPFHPAAWRLRRGDKRTHRAIIARMKALAARNRVPYIRCSPRMDLPDSLWQDYGHLNAAGAERFSRWLGRRMGTAARMRPIPPPLPGVDPT
jgi:hypothetical protein